MAEQQYRLILNLKLERQKQNITQNQITRKAVTQNRELDFPNRKKQILLCK